MNMMEFMTITSPIWITAGFFGLMYLAAKLGEYIWKVLKKKGLFTMIAR